MSRWSSPMPLRMVWPDSWSVETRNDGSSAASFAKATPSFSWSAFDFGSIAISITGSGNSIFSRMTGLFASHSVSPVRASFRPASATMSPAKASLMSSRLLACICSMRPMRSLRSRVELMTPVLGNFYVPESGVELLFFPDHALHADKIDQTLEIILGSDRKLDRDRLGTEAIDNILHAFVEIGAGLVHLVGEHDARNPVLVALTPDRLGLRLNALVGIEHAHRAVEHAQRTLDFNGEVDVAGGVDDVQALAAPERGGRGGRDRDAALLFLLHPVHRRCTFVHFADLVALAGIIKDALGSRGLAGIDMRHDTEVAVVLYGMNAGHGLFLKIRCFAVTSDSARRRGWLPPSGARLHASSRRFTCHSMRRAVRLRAAPSSSSHCGRAPPKSASGSRAPAGAPSVLRPEPDRWRRRRGATELRSSASRFPAPARKSAAGSAWSWSRSCRAHRRRCLLRPTSSRRTSPSS